MPTHTLKKREDKDMKFSIVWLTNLNNPNALKGKVASFDTHEQAERFCKAYNYKGSFYGIEGNLIIEDYEL